VPLRSLHQRYFPPYLICFSDRLVYGDFGGLGNISKLLGCIIIMAADRLYLPQLAQVLKSLLNTSVLPNIANPMLKDFLATSVDPIQSALFGLTLVVMMIIRPEGLVPSAERQAELYEVRRSLWQKQGVNNATVRSTDSLSDSVV